MGGNDAGYGTAARLHKKIGILADCTSEKYEIEGENLHPDDILLQGSFVQCLTINRIAGSNLLESGLDYKVW